MNRPVVKLRLVREVGGDHLPDTSASIGEPPPFGAVTFALKKREQPGTLRGLPAPVQPFQDHQSATPAAVAAPILHPHALTGPPAQAETTRRK
jgi:hypothetical protein